MANRFNGGRGAITCDNTRHRGPMIAAGVAFSSAPPHLPYERPLHVYCPEAVWYMGSEGRALHYCSAECAGNNPDAKPLFPPDLPGAAEMPRIYSADIGASGKVAIKGVKG
jgi:hypothetical protein